jgi:WD40 repeat protein
MRAHTGPGAEVWDFARRSKILEVKADFWGLFTVAFSPDGKMLATAGWEQIIRLWDVRTGELIRELPQRDTGAWVTLEFSPDGSTLVSSGAEGNATLWDVASGAQIGKLDGRALRLLPHPRGYLG